eukprot:gene1349-5794_t
MKAYCNEHTGGKVSELMLNRMMLLKVDEKDWDKADVTPAIVEYLKFGLRRLGISAESAKPGEASDTVWKIRK